MDDKTTCEYINDCIKEGTLYEDIQSLHIDDSLKEHLLEKVRDKNRTNSKLLEELHNYHAEVKKLKNIILKLVYELYGE